MDGKFNLILTIQHSEKKELKPKNSLYEIPFFLSCIPYWKDKNINKKPNQHICLN